MVGLLLLALGMQQAAPPVTAPAPTSLPMLEVVVATTHPGGGGGWAGNSGQGIVESYVHVRGCGNGASGRPPAEPLGTGWHIKGETLRRDVNSLTVRVEWQRLWENDRWIENGPRGAQEVTMKLGERLVLDSLPSSSSSCGEARLEAGVIPRQPSPESTRGVGSAGSGGFSGEGRAVLSGAGNGRATGRPNWLSSLVSEPGPPVDLELWLVDKRADGSEHAVRHLVRTGGENTGAFRFTSVVDGPNSMRSTIEMSGSIRTTGRRLMMRVERRFAVGDVLPPAANGINMITLAIPEPSEVIGIELPQMPRPIVPGHEFSLRLRLAPGK
jgi:hypothetical protein